MSDCWIETFTAKRFYPLRPDPADICIEDIAHALSNQCRFSGHVRRFYSVAQHSVLVSQICAPEHRLWGLLHDASEAYLVDLPRPIKHQSDIGAIYRVAEARLMLAICERFGLPPVEPRELKIADTALLLAEKRDLMPGRDWDVVPEKWGIEPCVLSAQVQIVPMLPEEAERAFLERFCELTVAWA